MEDQISSDKTRRFKVNEEIIRDFRRDYPDALSIKEFDRGFAHFHLRKGRYLGSAGRKAEGIKEIGKAIRYAPLEYTVWRSFFAVLLK